MIYTILTGFVLIKFKVSINKNLNRKSHLNFFAGLFTTILEHLHSIMLFSSLGQSHPVSVLHVHLHVRPHKHTVVPLASTPTAQHPGQFHLACILATKLNDTTSKIKKLRKTLMIKYTEFECFSFDLNIEVAFFVFSSNFTCV